MARGSVVARTKKQFFFPKNILISIENSYDRSNGAISICKPVVGKFNFKNGLGLGCWDIISMIIVA